jgi:hypothetical protein
MQKDPEIAIEVKKILELIKLIAPGKSVELRIPSYGVIQCVLGGNHRRGTPPNTVEMSGQTLIKLINDPTSWDQLCQSAHIQASGVFSDLSEVFAVASAKYKG